MCLSDHSLEHLPISEAVRPKSRLLYKGRDDVPIALSSPDDVEHLLESNSCFDPATQLGALQGVSTGFLRVELDVFGR